MKKWSKHEKSSLRKMSLAMKLGFVNGRVVWNKGKRTECTVLNCYKRATARGLCPMHSWRRKVHGSPDVVVRVGHPKGTSLTSEHRRKLSKAHRENGYRHSEETRKKMSESLRLTYINGRVLASTANLHNNKTGFYTSKKMHKRYEYKSETLEKWIMMGLDVDRGVEAWYYEPFSVPYWYRGRQHSYFVDFVVYYKGGRVEILEAKHSSHLWQEKVVAKRAAAELLAEQLKTKYRFITEKDKKAA
jgi:hypothetical protein